jgi:hypothetical protein
MSVILTGDAIAKGQFKGNLEWSYVPIIVFMKEWVMNLIKNVPEFQGWDQNWIESQLSHALHTSIRSQDNDEIKN